MNFIFTQEQKNKLAIYKDHIKLGFELEGLHTTSCLENKFSTNQESVKYWDNQVKFIVDQYNEYFDKMSFPESIEKILIRHAISIIHSVISEHIMKNLKTEQTKFYKILELQKTENVNSFEKLIDLLDGLVFSADVLTTPFIINKDKLINEHFDITLITNTKYSIKNADFIELDYLTPFIEFILNKPISSKVITKHEQFNIFEQIVVEFNEISKAGDTRDLEIYQGYLQAFLQDIYVNFHESSFQGISDHSTSSTNIFRFIKENKQIFQNLIYTTDIESRRDIRELLYFFPPKVQKKIKGKFNLYKDLQTKFKNKYGYKTLYSTSYNGTEHGNNWMDKVRFEPDFSIEGKGTPIEIITPPLPYDEQLLCLNRVLDFMRENDIITNSTCGCHVNISVDGFLQSDIDYNILFYLYRDENFRIKFRGKPDEVGYKYSTYQQEQLFDTKRIKHIWARMRRIPRNNKQLIQKINKFYYEINSSMYDKSLYTKYNCVHNHKSYLEFRTIGNNYADIKILKQHIEIISKQFLFSLLKPSYLVSKQKQKSFKYTISD